MSIFEQASLDQSTGAGTPESTHLSRRGFLGGLGGAAAAVVASGVIGLEPLANAATAAAGPSSGATGLVRRQDAFKIRMDAANYWRQRPMVRQAAR